MRSITRSRTSWCATAPCKAITASGCPGTDHAGIATQNVVERQLPQAEGTTRESLGRRNS
ncbi:MAG: class I tRNA ligase family protein [Nitrospiraceae bacterium]